MKIFEFRPGSYIDPVSGAVGVNTNGEFVRSEKGIAWRGTGSVGDIISYTNTHDDIIKTSGIFSGCAWVKFNDVVSLQGVFSVTNDAGDRFLLGMENGEIRWSELGGEEVSGGSIKPNEWYCIVFSCNNPTHTLYVNNVSQSGNTANSAHYAGIAFRLGCGTSSGANLNGQLGVVIIYDHILTEKERAKLYREFLQASPTSKIIA
jgi:hypothetical protein